MHFLLPFSLFSENLITLAKSYTALIYDFPGFRLKSSQRALIVAYYLYNSRPKNNKYPERASFSKGCLYLARL